MLQVLSAGSAEQLGAHHSRRSNPLRENLDPKSWKETGIKRKLSSCSVLRGYRSVGEGARAQERSSAQP